MKPARDSRLNPASKSGFESDNPLYLHVFIRSAHPPGDLFSRAWVLKFDPTQFLSDRPSPARPFAFLE